MTLLSRSMACLCGLALGDAILLAKHGYAAPMLFLACGFAILALLAESRRSC